MPRFFRKELYSNVLHDAYGSLVPFEALAGDEGVIRLEDTSLMVNELLSVCGRFGVSEITEAQYAELKKKHPFNGHAKPSGLPQLRVHGQFNIPRSIPPSAPAPAAVPAAEDVADLVRDFAAGIKNAEAAPPKNFTPNMGKPKA